MNKLLNSPMELPRSRGMNLILTETTARSAVTELIATLLLQGPLFVIAGGNWLPASALTSILSGNTPEVERVLNHLYTAYASTCYELFDILGDRRSNGEPILILDFLFTFYESDIPLSVGSFKLNQCCRELARLAFYRPVTVMTQHIVENSNDFLPTLTSVADRIFSLESEFELAKQPELFQISVISEF